MGSVPTAGSVDRELTGLIMLKLGSAFFLLLVQIKSLIQCADTLGPYHASVDDFGQAYSVPAVGIPEKMGEPMEGASYSLGSAPAGTQYIAIAAANRSPPGWIPNTNPASILLSSDPEAVGQRIVTDTTWRCATYPV